MRREVMVDEELAIHQEEGEVMECPADGEQARIVPKAVTDSYRERLVSPRGISTGGAVLTIGNRLNASSSREQVRTEDAHEH